MLIESVAAQNFINVYSHFLVSVSKSKSKEMLRRLGSGIEAYQADRSLFPAFCKGKKVNSAVKKAINSLQYKRWLCVKRLRDHFVFMDMETSNLYAVSCLTQPLDQYADTSYASLECGLMSYEGMVVCDGLVRGVVNLGRNYRETFRLKYAEIKAEKGVFNDLLP